MLCLTGIILSNAKAFQLMLNKKDAMNWGAFLIQRGVRLDRYQLLQIYMALGGIPHYLKEVEGGKTAAQNIEQICFSPNGLLTDEFQQLYPALFEQADIHIKIIRLLARLRQGMTRSE